MLTLSACPVPAGLPVAVFIPAAPTAEVLAHVPLIGMKSKTLDTEMLIGLASSNLSDTPLNLQDTDLNKVSGSAWNNKHLKALRVIRAQQAGPGETFFPQKFLPGQHEYSHAVYITMHSFFSRNTSSSRPVSPCSFALNHNLTAIPGNGLLAQVGISFGRLPHILHKRSNSIVSGSAYFYINSVGTLVSRVFSMRVS